MKRRLTLALIAPAILLLSACFGVETTYEVNADGSGSQTTRIAIPAELATSFGEEMPSIEEMEQEPEMAQLREALGDDGEIEFFSSEEEGVGFVFTVHVDASDDFGAAVAAKGEALRAAMPDDDDMGSMIEMAGQTPTLRRDGDTWVFEQTGVAIDPAALSELSGEDGDMAGMAAMFLQQTTITTRLNLPGEVVEHNADEVEEDGTLVWTQTGSDAPRTLTARSEVGGDGLSTLVKAGLLIGAIAVVLAIGGFILFGRKRRAAA